MSEQRQPGESGRPDALEELLRRTPARERPPETDAAVIREAVHAAWLQETHHARPHARRWAWAAAALLAITVGLFVARQPANAPVTGAEVARVDAVDGAVVMAQAGQDTGLAPGTVLLSGQVLTTRPGAHLSLTWNGGIRLRVDGGSRVELRSPDGIYLGHGRVYVDTAEAIPGIHLAIATDHGLVRHTGTRYQVRAGAALTEIWVREGGVTLDRSHEDAGTPTPARAGQRLAVADDGPVTVANAPTWGEPWHWIDATTPPFTADGRTVGELLDWMGRETGRRIVFASARAQREADTVQLHGDLRLGVDDALSVINETTDFRARIDGDRIEVSIP